MSGRKNKIERKNIRKEKAALIANLATEEMRNAYEAIYNAWVKSDKSRLKWRRLTLVLSLLVVGLIGAILHGYN